MKNINKYTSIKNKLDIINKISIELRKDIINIEQKKFIINNEKVIPAGIKYIYNNTHIHFINSLRN